MTWLFTSSAPGQLHQLRRELRQEHRSEASSALSLVRSVEIHELIRIVREPGSCADVTSGHAGQFPMPIRMSSRHSSTAVTAKRVPCRPLHQRGDLRGTLRVQPSPSSRCRPTPRTPPTWHPPAGRHQLYPDQGPCVLTDPVTSEWAPTPGPPDCFIRGGAASDPPGPSPRIRPRCARLLPLEYAPHATCSEIPPHRSGSRRRSPGVESAFPGGLERARDDSSESISHIYVSTDGEPFRIWLTSSPLTGAIYSGQRQPIRLRCQSPPLIGRGISNRFEPARTPPPRWTHGNRAPVITAPPATTIQRVNSSPSSSASDPDPNQRVFFTLLAGARARTRPRSGNRQPALAGDGDAPGSWNIRLGHRQRTPFGIRGGIHGLDAGRHHTARPSPPPFRICSSPRDRLEQPILATDPDLPRQTLRRTLLEAPRAATLGRTASCDGRHALMTVLGPTGSESASLTTATRRSAPRSPSTCTCTTPPLTCWWGGIHQPLPRYLVPDSALNQRRPGRDPGLLPTALGCGPVPASLALSPLRRRGRRTVADNQGDGALGTPLRPGASLTATRRVADLGFHLPCSPVLRESSKCSRSHRRIPRRREPSSENRRPSGEHRSGRTGSRPPPRIRPPTRGLWHPR